MIRYAERIHNCTVLGPGGERAVVWVHGCCFDCKGCIADNYKYGPYQEVTPKEMADWYCLSGRKTEGITISGGEPFLQAGELAEMIRLVRKKRDFGVIVYTGFLYEELEARAKEEDDIAQFLREIDLLIDGPYVEEQDLNQMAIGSGNQRILQLTDRYKYDVEAYYKHRGRRVEFRIFDGKTMLVGVPAQDHKKLWKKLNERPEEKTSENGWDNEDEILKHEGTDEDEQREHL